MKAPRSRIQIRIVKFRRGLIGLQRDLGCRVGMNRPFFERARGARILLYHGVCPDRPHRFNTLFVTRKHFEAQLKLYKKYCHVISLDDFYQQRFRSDRINLCLTFDDGFANNYQYVLPLLEQYQVPAAFFITGIRDAGFDILWNDVLCTAQAYGPGKIIFLNEEFRKAADRRYRSSLTGQLLVERLRKEGFSAKAGIIEMFRDYRKMADADYWLQMSLDEIRSMSASKWVTIGSHSYFHNELANMTVAALQADLVKSKKFLENITGQTIRALAFPYGSYTPTVVREAKAAGFTQLLATEFADPSDEEDAALRERLTVNPFISPLNQLFANINGRYD